MDETSHELSFEIFCGTQHRSNLQIERHFGLSQVLNLLPLIEYKICYRIEFGADIQAQMRPDIDKMF
jgi:hypothetical protein